MVASSTITFRSSQRLSHIEAARLADLAVDCGSHTIILDLSRCLEATTSALARLVLLRRELLAAGRDFRIGGLRGQPAKLLEVHRLEKVLPCLSDVPHDSLATSSCVDHHVEDYADNAGVLCLQ
jgi:hypothetical protein